MTLLDLLMLSAMSWYISYILTQLPGPFGWFDKMREWKGGKWHGRYGEPTYATWTDPNGIIHETDKIYPSNGLFDCIMCTGFWVSVGLALLTGHTVLDGIAVCGVMLWVHAYSSWVHIGGK